MDVLESLVRLRLDKDNFVNKRMSGLYRKIVICMALIKCKILTLDQMILLVDLEPNSNQIRKDISALIKQGVVIKTNFLYEEKYSTYSLSTAGLSWIIVETGNLSNQIDVFPLGHLMEYEYKKSRKLNASNHYTCICQIIISIICASKTPLIDHIICEKPFHLDNSHRTVSPIKEAGQIVPDVYFKLGERPVFIEADTTTVRFNAPKGPKEKIAKYMMLSDYNETGKPHIIFSIHKAWNYSIQTNTFTPQEVKILSNPAKQNNAIMVIRLWNSLIKNENSSDITIHILWDMIRKSALNLDKALIESTIITDSSTLLNCLCNNNFGSNRLSEIRNCVQMLAQQINKAARKGKIKDAFNNVLCRKQEIYETILASPYKIQAAYRGVSISCCSGMSLSESIPLLFPIDFFSIKQYKNILFRIGIVKGNDFILSILDKGHTIQTPENMITCNNVLMIEQKNMPVKFVYIENISDDVGGLLRADKIKKIKNDLFYFIFLVSDSFITAAGNMLEVRPVHGFPISKNKNLMYITYSQFLYYIFE